MNRVLLVDDDALLVAQLRRDLEAAGYGVATAAHGEGALAEFQRATPHAVILDWRLRGAQDGIEVLRRIRERAATPVLMLTARGELEDKLVGLGVGADDYLVKPFARKELLARLHALLRRAGAPAQSVQLLRPILSDAELAVDRDARRATLAGRELDLTKGEFELLAILLEHPDRAFHRGWLVGRLRGDTYAGTERAIDTLVVRLRRKLGRLAPRLETVFGVGYRWARGR